MKTILVSVLAFGLMTSAALAATAKSKPPAQSGPVLLTDAQMDEVSAGAFVNVQVHANIHVNLKNSQLTVNVNK